MSSPLPTSASVLPSPSAPPPPPPIIDAPPRRDWLNYGACVVDSLSWSVGIAFLSLTTTVPLFMRQLHASNLLIGLLPALVSLGYSLPGLFSARPVARLARVKWWLYVIAVLERLPLLAAALAIVALGASRPDFVLALFVAAFALHALCLGINQPAYWVIVGKLIPQRLRGRVFGWAGLLAGAFGLLVDPVTRHFLTPAGIASARGFGACFAIGVAILLVGITGFALLDEPRQTPAELAARARADVHAGHFLHDAARLLRGDAPLRRLIYGQSCLALTAVAQPFFVLEYSRRFHVGTGAVADFTTIGVVVGAVGSLAWGTWGDRHGNKGVLLAACALTVAAAGLTLALPPASGFYAVFAASALATSANMIAGYNMLLEFAGPSPRIPFYTALFNAAVAPFRTAAPLLGGLLADRYGYSCCFWLSGAAAVAGFAFTLATPEPRKAPGPRVAARGHDGFPE